MANWRNIFKIGSDIYTNINLKLNTKYHFSIFTNRYNATKHKVNVLPFLKNFTGRYGAKGYRLFVENTSESEFIIRANMILDVKKTVAVFEFGENGYFWSYNVKLQGAGWYPNGYNNKVASHSYAVNKTIKKLYINLSVLSMADNNSVRYSASSPATMSMIIDGTTYNFPIPTSLQTNQTVGLQPMELQLNKYVSNITLSVNLGTWDWKDKWGAIKKIPFITGYAINDFYYTYDEEINMEGDVMVIGTLENR